MSGYDGEIVFGTKIDSSGMSSGIKNLKGTALSSFAAIRDVMMGPVSAGKMIVQAFQNIKATVDKMEGAWSAQEEAIAILNSTLKATGATAWTSSKALQKMASEFQGFTKYGDEVVTNMQNVLLGFKNIKGDNFKEASLQILNMATVMKMDLTSAAQAVGKALDDPINGIDSLSRQGFKFSKDQKAMLKAMVEAGDIAGAQGIILKELATTYGGAAEAAGMTGTAIRDRLQNAIGDVNEEIGRSISNSLKPWRLSWINMAQAVGAAAKAQNDFREAIEKQDKGTATDEDRLLIAKEQLSALEAAKKYAPDTKAIEAQIDKQKNYIASLQKEIAMRDGLRTAAQKSADEAAKRQAEKDASDARQLAIATSRAKIEDEFSKTISEINRKEKSGMLTREEAESARQSALASEIDALVSLIDTEKVGTGVTTALLESKTKIYVDQAAAIEAAKKAVATSAELEAAADEEAKRRADAYGDAIVAAAKKSEAAKVSFDFDDIKKSVDALGSALESLAGNDGSFTNFASAVSSIVGIVASGGTDVSAWVALIDSLASMANAAGVEEFAALQEQLTAFGDEATAILGPLLGALSTGLSTIFGVVKPFLPILAIISNLLAFFVEIMYLRMKPVLDILGAAVSALSSVYIFMYNKVIVPVLNFVMIALNKMYNGFANFINSMLQMIDDIPLVDLGYRVSIRSEAAGTLSEISTAAAPTAAAKAAADELKDANKELAENKNLLTNAARAAELYNKQLTKVTQSVSSFYEGLQDVGEEISSTLVDSLLSGFDNDDFLFALEEYITESVVQAAVFTQSFMASVSSIGADLASAIAGGASADEIEAIKGRLTALYTTAASLAEAATATVASAFGSYDVGTLNVRGDQIANIHDREMILTPGISQEARSEGIYIGPMSGASNLGAMRQPLNITMTGNIDVDGRALARVAYQYQDELAGAAYGA